MLSPGGSRLGTIEVPDAQIAAICRELGAVLATRNIKDFEETGSNWSTPGRPTPRTRRSR
jgi:predicted nucleic acid-binding protein